MPVLVCGTGYTGEDGVELLIPPADAPTVWDAVLAAGAAPVGLAARDTLRLEVCFHLYGNDLMDDARPDRGRPRLVLQGGDRLHRLRGGRAARAAGPSEQLAPFVFTGPGIPRQGNAVVGGGEVTSGTLSPSLEVGIGMAYLPVEQAVPGTEIEVDVRGKLRPAVVKEKPLFKKRAA